MFFEYGGGFVSGAKVLPSPADVIYRNLGAFFAKKGYVPQRTLITCSADCTCSQLHFYSFFTIIADYRLAPEAKFPAGAEDVKDAIAWVVQHADEIAGDSEVKLDTENIFANAHSAGSVHVITSILLPGLMTPELRSRIKGLFLNGGAYTFRPELLPPTSAIPQGDLEAYYGGSGAQIYENEPLALLEGASQELLASLPPIVVSRAENEPEGIEQANIHFAKVAKEKVSGGKIEEYVMKGHNHVSASMCLGSGEGEEWANYAAEWFKAKAT